MKEILTRRQLLDHSWKLFLGTLALAACNGQTEVIPSQSPQLEVTVSPTLTETFIPEPTATSTSTATPEPTPTETQIPPTPTETRAPAEHVIEQVGPLIYFQDELLNGELVVDPALAEKNYTDLIKILHLFQNRSQNEALFKTYQGSRVWDVFQEKCVSGQVMKGLNFFGYNKIGGHNFASPVQSNQEVDCSKVMLRVLHTKDMPDKTVAVNNGWIFFLDSDYFSSAFRYVTTTLPDGAVVPQFEVGTYLTDYFGERWPLDPTHTDNETVSSGMTLQDISRIAANQLITTAIESLLEMRAPNPSMISCRIVLPNGGGWEAMQKMDREYRESNPLFIKR